MTSLACRLGLRQGLAGILLCVVAPQLANAETFTDPAGRFVVDLPAGWVSESPDEVAARDAVAGSAIRDRNWHFVGAFVPDGEVTEQSPYIIVQWTAARLGGKSWDQLEREFEATNMDAAMDDVESEVEALFGAIDIGRPVLDRGRGRLLLRMEMDTPDGRREIVSTGFLGKDGIAQIHCYAMEGDMSRASPQFDAVLGGFRFESGEAFTGELSAYEQGRAVGRVVGFAVTGAAVVAVLIALIVRARNGGKTRPRVLSSSAADRHEDM